MKVEEKSNVLIGGFFMFVPALLLGLEALPHATLFFGAGAVVFTIGVSFLLWNVW